MDREITFQLIPISLSMCDIYQSTCLYNVQISSKRIPYLDRNPWLMCIMSMEMAFVVF